MHPPDTRADLVAAVHFLHARGWAPATSSNYSYRVAGESEFTISRSGIDKGSFGPQHMMRVDADGGPVPPESGRPSAETLLHAMLYRRNANTGAVLHTHSVAGTVLSHVHAADGGLRLTGYEILKGLAGVTTHEAEVWLPIFGNSQDMAALSATIEAAYAAQPAITGFLLAGHGLYAWGATIADAKRHIEVFEFLFDCIVTQRRYDHGHS